MEEVCLKMFRKKIQLRGSLLFERNRIPESWCIMTAGIEKKCLCEQYGSL